MDYIFWSETESSLKDREALLKKALFYFLKDKHRNKRALWNTIKESEIIRAEKGKPYFENFDVEFSVSHSDNIWMVLFSDRPCGVDIQKVKKVNRDSIGKKYFKDAEIKYIKECGDEGFFHIWCMREAFGKMTGEGFHCNPPDFVDDNEERLDEVLFNGDRYFFSFHHISKDYICCSCCRNPEIQIQFMDDLASPDYDFALNDAGRKLGRTSISIKDLKVYMKRKGYDAEVVDEVIREYQDAGYLDDVKYGELYIRYASSKGYAKSRVARELKLKGLSQSDIEKAYELFNYDEDELPEWERALEIVKRIADESDLTEKGRLNDKVKGRVARRLYGYGYTTDAVIKAISEFEKSVN